MLDLQQAYLDANAKFDWDALRDKIWSSAPEATFFNLNGHTYNGRDHWVRLWQYYKQHMATGEWIPYDIGGVIGPDVAVVLVSPQDAKCSNGSVPIRVLATRDTTTGISRHARPWLPQGKRRMAMRSRAFFRGEAGCAAGWCIA